MLGIVITILMLVIGHSLAETVSVELEIGGERYKLSVNTDEEAAMDVAKRFCIENAAKFGLTSEEILMMNCATPVAEVVQEALIRNDKDIKKDSILGFTDDFEEDL